jgi:Zn-dependent M28 family amino/carboxypeptidase
MRKYTPVVIAAILLLAAFLVAGKIYFPQFFITESLEFDAQRAMNDVQYQMSLGPRIPDSDAHAGLREYVLSELGEAGWETEVQQEHVLGHTAYNLVGKRSSGDGTPWIIIGAHYDSRLVADQDPDPLKRTQPVPGANDGASGVAVLLELARVLPEDLPGTVWLVFFDLEDNGSLHGWEWILGSTAFVEGLQGDPDAAVIVDMIGDADLSLPYERNSTPELVQEIWLAAAGEGYEEIFLNQPGLSILDDHTPFLRAGIPAADIIDFTYPYWHTTQDTADKVAPASLKAVGDTLIAWLKARLQE